jgi:hypothetical protein
MTARERASAAFDELVRKGVPPFEDCGGWMNPEDKDAVIEPFAKAIQEAVEETLETSFKAFYKAMKEG